MTVTVAIPCYNGARFIGATIESVLGQSRRPEQILVVDDGSTDDSPQTAAGYPVTVIRHEQNRGLAAARNTALDAAAGEILAFLDVDALADPSWLASLLDAYGGRDLAGVGGQGIEVQIHSLADRWRALRASQGHGPHPRASVDFLSGLNMSYYGTALRAVGGFDPRLRTNAEDADMGFRLNDAGYRLAYTPAARVYHQRQDTEETLRQAMYRWYFWAAVVKRKNGRHPATLAVGTVRRHFLAFPADSLLRRRSMGLARLDLMLGMTKLRAVRDGSRYDWG